MNKIIMSDERPEIVDNIKKFGYEVIASDLLDNLLNFEKRHADIQCLKIKDTYFVLKNCEKLSLKLKDLGLKVIKTQNNVQKNYPENVLLNCVFIDDKLFCKESAVDESVRRFCNSENIQIINVNQGYTKCSTAIIDNKFITADKGIYNTLSQNGVEGLLINCGDVQLDGVDYGFIGGCCFSDEYNVYFSGDVTSHSSYNEIRDFCYNQNKNIICLSDKKLYDIGGFVVI